MAEPELIEVRCDVKPGAVVVRPSVDIDMSRSPSLREAVQAAHESRPETLIIDLSDVAYMDSSGLATLVEAMRTAKANRTQMVICGMHERVRAIFQIARLDQFFKIVETLDDALQL